MKKQELRKQAQRKQSRSQANNDTPMGVDSGYNEPAVPENLVRYRVRYMISIKRLSRYQIDYP
ncbi:10848_t:CDS:2 [Funneliformis caledonium]|uniref:10848_t:CDS:1 n=1 Tax=Funneliformis caledonium TaxID=1117310 RepID=A0A9N9GW00_9GLOM|nr:10848_t:CDS:2 [Funneliformis caledonium]